MEGMEPSADHLRFTRLWMQAQPVVTSLLTLRLRDRAAVDDLTQEVALAALQGFAEYDATRSFTAWTVGIAQHKAIDWLRRNGARKLVITDEEALATLATVGAELDRELSERELALHGCVEVLTGRGRDVVRLHYAEGLPLTDIADRLSLSLANVKVILHRIREALRACVERRLAAEGR